jgi:hypothetical protein
MHHAIARCEDHGVQAFPDEPQHLKSPLSIRFAGVLPDQRSGPFHLLDELKRQTSTRDVGDVFGRIKSNAYHFIVCTLN